MNKRFYVSMNETDLLDVLTTEQNDWFAVPGDLDDFIFWDDQSGPSEK